MNYLGAWLAVVAATIAAGTLPESTAAAPPSLSVQTVAAEAFVNNDVTQVSAHEEYTCALRLGSVYCWGNNFYGMIGDGSSTRSTTPVPVTLSAVQPGFSNTSVTSLATGYAHTCAVENGVVYCWGLNGQATQYFGDGSTSTSPRLRPVRIVDGDAGNSDVTQVAIGWYHSCLLKQQAVYCWGRNNSGELGDGTVAPRDAPTRVTASATTPGFTNTRVTSVALGLSHTCAIEDGQAYCWGLDQSGRLGHGGTELNSGQSLPLLVTQSATQPGFLNTAVTAIGTGYTDSTCGLVSTSMYCWGRGVSRPTAVADNGGFTSTSVSTFALGAQTCAVSNGSAYCWGSNGDGNLGDGTFTARSLPTRVTNSAILDNFPNDGITSLSGAGGTYCALRHDVVYCWGANYGGQLGNGTMRTGAPWGHPFPVRVAGAVAAPGQPTATPDDEEVTVSWPAVGGVLEYVVTGAPAGTCTVAAPTTSCTITGLTNGIAHTFVVTASVSGRSSPDSLASASVTPGVPAVSVPVASPAEILVTRPAQTVTSRIPGNLESLPVTLSQRTFQPGVAVVYLATRRTLIDALVAGPAAGAGGGPVLTVGPDGLDDATLAELRRLQPRSIVVMGGDEALPSTLDAAIGAAVGYRPDRVDGGDRYATAARLSARNHTGRTQVVYVATGEVLVDAVAGGPAAGLERAPVLLVRPDALPAATATELRRLQPDRIVIVGGTDAVSPEVERMLGDHSPVVQRIGGVDRYATAVAVAQQRFPSGAEVVYMTVGDDAPLASSVIPVATVQPGPMLFMRSTCLPPGVRAEILRLDPERLEVLGDATTADPLSLPDCDDLTRLGRGR